MLCSSTCFNNTMINMQTLEPDGLISNPGLTLISCRILDISIFLYFSLLTCKMDIKLIATSLGCGDYVVSGLSSILRFIFCFCACMFQMKCHFQASTWCLCCQLLLPVRTCIICVIQDPKVLGNFLSLVPLFPQPLTND